jgi:hypothetical protein
LDVRDAAGIDVQEAHSSREHFAQSTNLGLDLADERPNMTHRRRIPPLSRCGVPQPVDGAQCDEVGP